MAIDRTTLLHFWKSWQHEPDATKEFVRFRARAIEAARGIWSDYIQPSRQLTKEFAFISGTPFHDQGAGGTSFHRSELSTLLQEAKTPFEVAEALQFLLWTISSYRLKDCCDRLQRIFDISPNFMLRVVQHEGQGTIYPSGAKLLDEATVESNLVWLSRYPDALKAFENALKLYMGKDPEKYRSMLDSLRFSIEQVLRAVLKNQKSLENQKEEFLRWLKAHDAHSHIAGMYHELLFNRFTKYQNDAVKHQEDKYTPAEVEFTLYLTGTFLRFIQRLDETPAVASATS